MKNIAISLIVFFFSLHAFGSNWSPAFEYGISDFVSRLALVEDEKRLKEVSKELAKYIFESESDDHVSIKLSILAEQVGQNKAFDKSKTRAVFTEVAKNLYSSNAHITNFRVMHFSAVLFVALTFIADGVDPQSIFGFEISHVKDFAPAIASWVFHMKHVLQFSSKYKKKYLDSLLSEPYEVYQTVSTAADHQNSCVGLLSPL